MSKSLEYHRKHNGQGLSNLCKAMLLQSVLEKKKRIIKKRYLKECMEDIPIPQLNRYASCYGKHESVNADVSVGLKRTCNESIQDSILPKVRYNVYSASNEDPDIPVPLRRTNAEFMTPISYSSDDYDEIPQLIREKPYTEDTQKYHPSISKL